MDSWIGIHCCMAIWILIDSKDNAIRYCNKASNRSNHQHRKLRNKSWMDSRIRELVDIDYIGDKEPLGKQPPS